MVGLKELANKLAELDIDALEDADDLRRTLLIQKSRALQALADLEGSTPEQRERLARIREMAREHEREGDLELDDEAVVSEGDDNGAYVQMWKWIDFSGTELCKDPESCDQECRKHG